jgi:hypothetical protein
MQPVIISAYKSIRLLVLKRTSSADQESSKSSTASLSNSNQSFLIMFHRDCYSYTYSVLNMQNSPIEISIDLTQSKDMLFMPRVGKVTKVIQPGELEYLVHCIADPSADSFTRKCNVQHSNV